MSASLENTEARVAPTRKQAVVAAVRHWSPILAKFVSIQIVVQALGLLTGIMLVRTLTQHEYAYYTLANTMQVTLLLLADIGVGSALSSRGGEVWQDRRRFGELIRTGLHVRKYLARIGGLVSLPILFWLLLRNGTGFPYACLLVIAVLLGANFRLTNDVLTFIPKLHGHIDRLQKLDLCSAVFRLIALGAACLTFVDAALGVFVASLSFGLQYLMLRRWAPEGADLTAPINQDDRKHIFRIVRQTAPNTIYYCIQSQITIFLISVFGSTRTLAEVGALGRLTMFFSIVASIMNNIIVPRFARCRDKSRLRRMWWQIIGAYLILATIIMCLVIFVPQPFLWLLGKQYAHAGHAFAYIAFSTVISMIAGVIYGLNTSRAWTSGAWISIPIVIVTQAALIPFVNLHTIVGTVLVTALPIIPGVIPFLYQTYKALRSTSEPTEFTPKGVV